ncbi:hypothetical protein IW249_005976 [Micromonospora vinacea]|uniref:Uncharacterized protein n=1 Tax=Micromonospora vinacea TaxID=709878 RepID=A0ABS0KA89_9ACTN|nr:hypothetical protein [Micromonospora vinacea]MBG6105562.1 hypothetical protein [Micromonospora vinacea]
MSYADLTVAQWNDLADGAARRLSEEIADRHGLTVPVGLQDTVYAGRSHRVALFERDGMRFALVPGGRPTLGHDAARFRPTPHQLASYADSAEEYGLPPLAEYVDATTSPVRSVELPAMLVAVEAFNPCEVSLTPDDPRVLNLIASKRAQLDGVSQSARHRETNLWGLTIGQDPYRHEATIERTTVCGGDGGSTTCGGSGFFLGWLALATAYRDKDFGQWLASDKGGTPLRS